MDSTGSRMSVSPAGVVVPLITLATAIVAAQEPGAAPPAVILNEIVVNPNTADENCEYAELRGPEGLALGNVYFVSIEGDASSSAGTFDLVNDLHFESLGTNGLLVITAMSTTGACAIRQWGLPQGTTLVRDPDLDDGGLENGTNSWLVIYSPTEMILETVDYDTDDDGILEALPTDAVILDGVGWSDGGASDVVYSSVILPATAGGPPDMASRFLDGTVPLDQGHWYYGDMEGSANSTMYDLSEVSPNFPEDGALTPGLPNVGTLHIFEDGFESGNISGWSSAVP